MMMKLIEIENVGPYYRKYQFLNNRFGWTMDRRGTLMTNWAISAVILLGLTMLLTNLDQAFALSNPMRAGPWYFSLLAVVYGVYLRFVYYRQPSDLIYRHRQRQKEN